MTLGKLLGRLTIAAVAAGMVFSVWNAGERVQHARDARCREGVVWLCDK